MARRTLAAFFILVAGCQHIPDSAKYPLGNRDYRADPSVSYKRLELSRLSASPTTDLAVSFLGIFDRHDEKIWSPLYTPFTSEDYISFSVWPPEARIWELEGRQSSVPTLFMSKQHAHLDRLIKVSRYTLVEIKGTVKSIFADRPWIDVQDIVAIGQGPVYDDESLRRLIFGMEDTAKSPASAIKNLDLALRGRLYTPARVVAHAQLGDLYEKRASMNRDFWKNAFDHYDAALHLDPSNKACREGLDRAAVQVDLLKKEKEVGEKPPEQPAPPPEQPK